MKTVELVVTRRNNIYDKGLGFIRERVTIEEGDIVDIDVDGETIVTVKVKRISGK
jgi:hypothetical protein